MLSFRNGSSPRTGTASSTRGPEERRLWHLDAARELVAAQACFRHFDRTQGRCLAVDRGQRARGLGALGPRLLLGLALGEVGRKAAGDDPVHQVQAVEGVAGVGDLARGVGAHAVVLDVLAGQRRAPQHHRHVQALTAHLEHVLAHDHGRLDQKARHADRVGAMLLKGRQNVGERLLDAEIHDLVAVVRQNNVDQVLADVVDVALHGREHDRAFVAALDPLHVRLEVSDRGLHGLGALEHERELHLAAAEQFAHHLHAIQEVHVDDVERRVPGQRLVEVGLEALAVAIDDPAA